MADDSVSIDVTSIRINLEAVKYAHGKRLRQRNNEVFISASIHRHRLQTLWKSTQEYLEDGFEDCTNQVYKGGVCVRHRVAWGKGQTLQQ